MKCSVYRLCIVYTEIIVRRTFVIRIRAANDVNRSTKVMKCYSLYCTVYIKHDCASHLVLNESRVVHGTSMTCSVSIVSTGSTSLRPLVGASERMSPRIDLSSRRLFLSILLRKAFSNSPITSSLSAGAWGGGGGGGG